MTTRTSTSLLSTGRSSVGRLRPAADDARRGCTTDGQDVTLAQRPALQPTQRPQPVGGAAAQDLRDVDPARHRDVRARTAR